MSEAQEEDILHSQEMVSTNNLGIRLILSDYDKPCLILARNLLGLHLCRRLDSGEEVKGIIVETECYLGGDDKASHSFAGKKTERNAAMYMSPGTAYVYSTYGMYHCINISSKGDGAAVLIRALEPLFGFEAMRENRVKSQRGRNLDKKKKCFTIVDLCNGPSKLCMSLAIDKSLNKENMVISEKLWVEHPSDLESEKKAHSIIACPRIGIDYAGKDWVSKPLRFYINGNSYVSKRNKKAEQSI